MDFLHFLNLISFKAITISSKLEWGSGILPQNLDIFTWFNSGFIENLDEFNNNEGHKPTNNDTEELVIIKKLQILYQRDNREISIAIVTFT
ncbi:3541_t:CDS:2 [Gigaspora rosea]|nr:3541_t:CDS:2 [Gigaspora rosea]